MRHCVLSRLQAGQKIIVILWILSKFAFTSRSWSRAMPWTPSFPGTGQGDQGFRPDRVGPVRRSRNPPPVGLGMDLPWNPGRSPALPWPRTARWSICLFLISQKMRKKDRGFPGWGVSRTGGETGSKTTFTKWKNTGERGLGNPEQVFGFQPAHGNPRGHQNTPISLN